MQIRIIDYFTSGFMVVLIGFGFIPEPWKSLLFFFHIFYWSRLDEYTKELQARKNQPGPFAKRKGEYWIVIWLVFYFAICKLNTLYPNHFTVPPDHAIIPLGIVFNQYYNSKREELCTWWNSKCKIFQKKKEIAGN